MNYAKIVIETIYRTLMHSQMYAVNGRINSALKNFPKLCVEFENWLVKYTNYMPLMQKDRKRIYRYDTKQVFDITEEEIYQKCVIEFISGMTDQFAIEVYEEIIQF